MVNRLMSDDCMFFQQSGKYRNTQIVPRPTSLLNRSADEIEQTFARQIDDWSWDGRMSAMYNFKLSGNYLHEVISAFYQVFRKQTCGFRVNISAGVMLRNRQTNSRRYFRPSRNSSLLWQTPKFIRTYSDFLALKSEIEVCDLVSWFGFNNFPNSKWQFEKMLNCTFYVTRLVRIPIGRSDDTFPSFLRTNPALYSLTNKKRTGKLYQDGLCFWRCLAIFFGREMTPKITPANCETTARRLYTQFYGEEPPRDKSYIGIQLDDIDEVSKKVQTGINVYALDENRTAKLLYRSVIQDNIMHLNLFEDHFSYIICLNMYSQSYVCPRCSRNFDRYLNMTRHLGSCFGATREIYCSGKYTPKLSVFERIAEADIFDVEQTERFFEYFLVWDIECLMVDSETPASSNTVYQFQHKLASVAINSNVPGFSEPVCFVSRGDDRELIGKMVEYMTMVAETSCELMREKHSSVWDVLESADSDELSNSLDKYCTQLPVLSFNGSKYDTVVILKPLMAYFVEEGDINYVIKKGANNYTAISTDRFLWLDVCSYLAPGTSLSSFLRAYDCTEQKFYFPYEMFRSFDQLETQNPPPFEAYYSRLKRCNTLVPTHGEQLTGEEIVVIGKDLKIYNTF